MLGTELLKPGEAAGKRDTHVNPTPPIVTDSIKTEPVETRPQTAPDRSLLDPPAGARGPPSVRTHYKQANARITKSIGKTQRMRRKQEDQAVSPNNKKNSRYWQTDEHKRFVQGLSICGHKDHVGISSHVGTRNSRQVRTHAQKYYIRMVKQVIDAARSLEDGRNTEHSMSEKIPEESFLECKKNEVPCELGLLLLSVLSEETREEDHVGEGVGKGNPCVTEDRVTNASTLEADGLLDLCTETSVPRELGLHLLTATAEEILGDEEV